MTDTKIKPEPEDFAKGNLDFCVEFGGIPAQLKEIETDDVIAGHLYRLAQQAKVIRLAEKEMETDDAIAGHLYRLAQGAKAWPEDEAIPLDDPIRNRLFEQDWGTYAASRIERGAVSVSSVAQTRWNEKRARKRRHDNGNGHETVHRQPISEAGRSPRRAD